MSDKNLPDPPNLGVIDGGKAKRVKHIPGTGAKTTLERYKAMEEWWLKKDRNIRQFARVFGVSERQAHRLVHLGVPSRKFPPLAARAAEYDAQSKKENSTVREAQLKLEATEWARTKRGYLNAIRNSLSLMALVQNELIARYSSAGPRPLNGQLPGQLRELIGLARHMAQAIKDLGEEERRWIHGVAPPEQGDADSPFTLLNPEQVAYIEETGRLPPGVDPAVVDQFFKRLGLPSGLVG